MLGQNRNVILTKNPPVAHDNLGAEAPEKGSILHPSPVGPSLEVLLLGNSYYTIIFNYVIK